MWCSLLPLLFSLSPAVLILLQLPDYTDTQEDYKYGHPGSEKKFCTWKCVLFTVQWPAGFCQELKAELTELWPSLLKIKSSFHFWLLGDAGITPSCDRLYKVTTH
ncbi:hypothetical protein GBF38_002674 [Nibea albiflora]|uniref:Uncharacterized protein n=1 Tax=Nibea albiflora TaxID=240163 RepID=A0ACB7EHL2_NIBAL|nr:hypothetical protein GBF38_002674 [Nibea albiflora]